MASHPCSCIPSGPNGSTELLAQVRTETLRLVRKMAEELTRAAAQFRQVAEPGELN
jgi:hypothetical protein